MYIHTVDIVDKLLTQYFDTIKGEYIEMIDNLDGTYTITTCDPYHLRYCSEITLDGNAYTVEKVTGYDVLIKGSVIPGNSGSFTLPRPFYFHNTPTSLNACLASINSTRNKFPMVYLYEWLKDRNDYNPVNIIGRRTVVRLFWLDEIIFQDWDTDKKYVENMTPMANIADGFVKFLKKHKDVANELENVDIIPMTNFNIQVTVDGVEKSMFPDPTAGIELQLELPLLKNICDCTKCK